MGVNLTPIMIREVLDLQALSGKRLAVDANNYLYQFLALIRTPDGTPLKDSSGNVTSHLMGLMLRTTRLISDYKIGIVFVFDGEPPKLKAKEIAKRREMRQKVQREWQKALSEGNYQKAFSKAVMTSRLTQPMIGDAKRLLTLLGIPFVQAPSEAEAQAAYMATRDDVWAASSKDYDSLLFGAPKLLRFLTITGKEFLPSKKAFRPLKPELIELQKLLSHHEITRQQLVDLAILVGTDFDEGVKGVGPKKALTLIKTYSELENLPNDLREKLPENFAEVRQIFLQPKIIENYSLKYSKAEPDKLYSFLCGERDFSRERVETVVKRMEKVYIDMKQTELGKWF